MSTTSLNGSELLIINNNVGDKFEKIKHILEEIKDAMIRQAGNTEKVQTLFIRYLEANLTEKELKRP